MRPVTRNSIFSPCRLRTELAIRLLLLATFSIVPLLQAAPWLSRPWLSDEGLPDNSVSGVAQSRDGYLWVATLGGLVRFDGVRFQEFPPTAIAGVPNRVVRGLFSDSSGRLWLGMDRGPVVCLSDSSARVFSVEDGLPDFPITTMAEDGGGAIWIGYSNGALLRIAGTEVRTFGPADGLPSEGACWLDSDTQGNLWVAKGGQVGVLRDARFVSLLTFDQPTTVGRSRRGGIWICSGPRVLHYDGQHPPEERGQLPNQRERMEPRAVLEDRQGGVWIGTAASGLFHRDDSGVSPVQTSHREIACLTEDREGNIWAGTAGGGLNRLRARPVELWGATEGLPFESVRSVCHDGTGALWLATQNGLLARQENNVWRTVDSSLGWTGGDAMCVASDGQGIVWLGSRNRGLYRFSNGRFENWRRRDGLGGNTIRSLLPASGGDLWIGLDSPNQVQRFRQGRFLSFEINPSPRYVRAMAEDASGTVWIGTADGQLLRADGDQLINETPFTPGRPWSIRSLHATSDGSLWIGYAGWGLGHLKGDHFSRIDAAHGLNDDFISQIVSDERGWLWLAGNRGVFQVRLDELLAISGGRGSHVRSIVYGRDEGLPSLQASFDYFPGALRSRDGRLWIPTRSGLAVVRPDQIRDNPDPPRVLLERVALDGATIALQASRLPLREPAHRTLPDLRDAPPQLHFGPDHGKLDIEFTALSFSAPDNVHFRYRLEGVDLNWITTTSTRSASYSRLPAGSYRFQVQACNNAGLWNESGAALGFVVLPFFWQTWWFRAAALAGFTLGVVGTVRYVSFRRLHAEMRHLEHQAALHKERARIAKDIHDDLGASLTQIGLLSELAQQDREAPEKAGAHMEKVAVTARHLIKSLDEIVWAVNPRNDTLAHLIDYTGQFALDYLRVAGIRCRLDFPEQAPQREVSTDVRHNLFLVVKEALHNIVKHSQASEVWLRIAASSDQLRITIEDNGRGFEGPPHHTGADGLRNMRQRVAEIGGTCHIGSQSGAGTSVQIEIAWTRVSRPELHPSTPAP